MNRSSCSNLVSSQVWDQKFMEHHLIAIAGYATSELANVFGLANAVNTWITEAIGIKPRGVKQTRKSPLEVWWPNQAGQTIQILGEFFGDLPLFFLSFLLARFRIWIPSFWKFWPFWLWTWKSCPKKKPAPGNFHVFFWSSKRLEFLPAGRRWGPMWQVGSLMYSAYLIKRSDTLYLAFVSWLQRDYGKW